MTIIRSQIHKGLVQSQSLEKDCWVDIRDASKQDLLRLEREFGVAPELLADIMDIDEQARIEKEETYTALIMRLPVYDESYEVSFFTVPVGILLFNDKIITVCQKSSDVLDEMSGSRVRDLNLRNKSSFVLNLMGRAALVYLKALKELNKKTAIIERELQKSVRNNELVQLLSIQKSLVFFTTSIKTNELLLEKLQKSPLIHFKEDEQELLEDVLTDNKQAIEMANIYSSILTGTMDAFASVISNNLNIVMKRLTIVSIALMIPAMVSGLFGMNVPLPFQDSPFAFAWIVGLSLSASIIGATVLGDRKRKKLITKALPYTHNLMVHR
ncbi:MAG: magnesium transporter [Spirochaetes bacterium]|nr:MAG: magnesium transporter [Spirochaetota bacterium]